MLKDEDIRALGQIFNHTFGYSSDSIKVTSSLHGDSLILKYVTILQFGSESSMQEQMPSHEKDASKVIDDALTKMKKEFKDIREKSISVKEEDRDTSVELISTSPYSPRKLAYFRMNAHFKVS